MPRPEPVGIQRLEEDLHSKDIESKEVTLSHPEAPALAPKGQRAEQKQEELAKEPFVREEKKTGRNEPCPCGSGKKYKKCHGA